MLCPKCEHLNRWGENVCDRCGAHLYVACNDCGEKNERVRTRCRSCGRRLHRGLAERVALRVSTGRPKFKPLIIFLFVVIVAIAYQVIVLLSGGSPL